MKRFLLVASFFVFLVTNKVVAQGLLASNIPSPQPSFTLGIGRPLPVDHPMRPIRAYSPHKEHVANRLMIAGGVCIAVGVPVLLYGIAVSKRPNAVERTNAYVGMPMAILGGYTTLAGLGLTIPGALIKHSNHRHRRLFTE